MAKAKKATTKAKQTVVMPAWLASKLAQAKKHEDPAWADDKAEMADSRRAMWQWRAAAAVLRAQGAEGLREAAGRPGTQTSWRDTARRARRRCDMAEATKEEAAQRVWSALGGEGAPPAA